MKKLLVRGDDLGYSEGVTLGMLSAYEKGIVNFTRGSTFHRLFGRMQRKRRWKQSVNL